MADQQGQPCPECGASRAPDNTPSCGCGRRASDALVQSRTAEAAAAEDFNPLRIRPYVDLDAAGAKAKPAATGPAQQGPAEPGAQGQAGAPATGTPSAWAPSAAGTPAAAPAAPRASHADAEETMQLSAVPQAGRTAPGDPAGATGAAGVPGGAAGVPGGAAGAQGAPEAPTTALPAPLGLSVEPPRDHDLRLFEASDAGQPGPPSHRAGGGSGRGRARRTALIASAGAVVAVVAAAGLASGLFQYDTPSRETATAEDVREAASEAPSSDAASLSATPSDSAEESPSASASPSESASPSAGESASPSPSESSESPSASTSPTPSVSEASPLVSEDPGTTAPADGPVLRRGDQGPEVAELQARLRQLYLYNGDINGNFNHPLENALRNYQWARGLFEVSDMGVYDQPTRAMLESETSEP
ncbi:peptidoglycan-binding domain-containing protein [Streptomyces sp. NPDC058739]|uniref:peptidoglycan-binding domain-containing protein n=1 Tax=Streptomyces sp. NPDC058739 TaxID=3346618 RepID=UPI0036A54745